MSIMAMVNYTTLFFFLLNIAVGMKSGENIEQYNCVNVFLSQKYFVVSRAVKGHGQNRAVRFRRIQFSFRRIAFVFGEIRFFFNSFID